MDFSLSQLTSILPIQIDFSSMVKFIGAIVAGALVLGLMARIVYGKHSSLNHAISSAMGILFVYVATIVVYTFNPAGLSRFLAPLPFVTFSEDYLYILSLTGAGLSTLCEHALSLIVLAFLVNLIDHFIPKGKKLIGWYIHRFLGVGLSIGLHYLVTWASHKFLPGVLVTYAPIILLSILLISLLLGVLKGILSLVLIVINPIIGAVYAFFFSNILGKQLSKAVLTSGLICGVIYALEHWGYSVICISAAALISYLPLLIVLLLLWYLIGHLL